MVAGFLDAIAKVRQFKFHNDDDLYDRLSRRFSVVLLMLFTVVVSTKQYVGDPIACFAPAQFTGKYIYIYRISRHYVRCFNQNNHIKEEEKPFKKTLM
jgi:hypothetical protein